MRPWFVLPLLLSGCATEFTSGQVTEALGLDPYGGTYNPHLAGCETTELALDDSAGVMSGWTFTYDSRGRLTETVFSDPSLGAPMNVFTRWDGPCRVNDTQEIQNGERRIWDYTCDAEGWPVSGTQRNLDNMMEELEASEASWENTYEEDRLVHVVSSDGDVTDLEWADDRVVRREKTNINGVLDTETFVFNDDGWVIEFTINELVTTYAYDDRKRLISAVQGETRTDWTYEEDRDEWPSLRTYTGNGIIQQTGLALYCR